MMPVCVCREGRAGCQRNEILFFGQNVHFHFEDVGGGGGGKKGIRARPAKAGQREKKVNGIDEQTNKKIPFYKTLPGHFPPHL